MKLYRSIDQNELLENDNTAYVVFTKLLTRVDRRTGAYRTGRIKLASICNLRPSTVRDALNRLQAATMLRQESDSKATTIYICNWWKYQQDDDSKPSVARQATDTKQEREKEKDTKVSAKTPSVEIDEMFEAWFNETGYAINGQRQKNRYACSNLLKKHGKETVLALIRGVARAQGVEFAPQISDFVALQSKQNALLLWGKDKNKPKATTSSQYKTAAELGMPTLTNY